MKLGFVSAILPDLSLEEVLEFAAFAKQGSHGKEVPKRRTVLAIIGSATLKISPRFQIFTQLVYDFGRRVGTLQP